jgi:predicted dehydrogenase
MQRIALIGAGLIGREHASLLRAHNGASLIAIADPSPGSKHYADEIGVPHYSDFRLMLDETNPDGVIVAVPNTLHVEAGLACIDRGLPCLVEKPIADTISAAKRLVDASELKGVPVLVGHHRRHSPDIREAKRAIEDGLLGDLVTVTGMWLSDKPQNYFDIEWRRRAGGGPLLINLIHDIDCLRFICGEIHSVKAFTSNAVRSFEVEDTASLAIRFESGVLGSFCVSDVVASPYNWEFSSGQARSFPHEPGDCYYFGGRKGSLAVPSMNLWRHDKENGNWQDPFVRQHLSLDGSRTYVNQLDHFLDVTRGNVTSLVSAREGMMTLAAVLAASTAAIEDRTVTVAEICQHIR